MRRLLALVAVVGLASCGRETEPARRGGTVVVGIQADADALLMPLINGIYGKIVSELLFDRLADMGPSLNTVGDEGFVPRLARRWVWSDDSLAITFALDPDAKWHDGAPVRAADVVLGFSAIRDTSNASSLNAAIENVTTVVARDSVTVEVRFDRRAPEQFYSATQIVPLPSHVYGSIPSGTLRTSAAAQAPVGSGRFRLVRWERGARIELAAVDDHYRGRPHLDRVLFSIAPEAATGIARLKAGETDVWDPVPPAEVQGLMTEPGLRVFSSPSFDYGFLAFNFRDPRSPSRPHPLLSDIGVRRAITLAVDRSLIVKAVFDTLALPGLGPQVRAQATADTAVRQIPFDRAAAEALLDSLGWRERGSNGVRRKQGRELAFSVILPSTSRPRVRAAELIQEQLRTVGIAMTIEPMDFPVFLDAQTSGKFDAVMGTTRTTPSPGGLRGSWASAAIAGGGTQNPWHYSNPEFDAAVEAGLGALDPAVGKARLRRAYQVIIDDAAAVWLFELRNVSAVHRRIVMPPWRPDAWWSTLGEWSIDPTQRLPRDAAPATP